MSYDYAALFRCVSADIGSALRKQEASRVRQGLLHYAKNTAPTTSQTNERGGNPLASFERRQRTTDTFMLRDSTMILLGLGWTRMWIVDTYYRYQGIDSRIRGYSRLVPPESIKNVV